MTYEVYLAHHGVKGQKWYVRRYQNEDGTLTAAGKKRYGKEIRKDAKDFLRKDAGLSRREARKGAKVVERARMNKDEDVGRELTDLVRKITKGEYEAANKFVSDRTNGKRTLNVDSASKAFTSSKKMAKAYEAFGKSTLKALHLDDKYDFLADLDESLSGLFINSEVHDKQTYAKAVEQARQEEEMEKLRRKRAGLG